MVHIQNIIILFLTLFCTSLLYGQTTIRVMDQNSPLNGAHVIINKAVHGITDESGDFIFDNSSKVPLRIEVSHIGFIARDTIVPCNTMNCDSIEIVMQEESIAIEEIEITAEASIFKNKNVKIRDVSIHPEGLVFIYSEEGEGRIGLFTKGGYELYSEKLKKPYHTIIKGLKPGYYNICTENKCQEMFVSHDAFININEYRREYVEENISSYIMLSKDRALRKEFSYHNQFFVVAEYDNQINRKVLCEVFNQEGYTRANSTYFRIIGLYHSVMDGVGNKKVISTGIRENDIIKQGLWSGDVRDLNENNDLNELIGVYIHQDAKRIPVDAFYQDEHIYLFDALNDQIVITNIYTGHKKVLKFVIDKDMKVLLDDDPTQFYFISDKDLYALNTTNTTVSEVKKMPSTGMYIKNQIVSDGRLIQLRRTSNAHIDYIIEVMPLK